MTNCQMKANDFRLPIIQKEMTRTAKNKIKSGLMNMKLYFLVSLSLFCVSELLGQIVETRNFEQKKYKTFSSIGHPKSRGLLFSIKYPSTYILQEIKNENIVKGFVHENYYLIYMIGVIKKQAQIEKDDEQTLLSEENFKQSVIAYTSNNQIFLSYKNGLEINGMSSAYLEYMANVAVDTKSYVRQYFMIYKNYFLTASFTVPKQPDGTLEEAKTRFDNYKSFFDLAINTLIITK
jgi:hypothetical protein